MNMENDIDSNLLMQFSCMGTTDKDELVKQLQCIVGHHLNYKSAEFFLEMNNWNLQGAVGSYFDVNNSLYLPSMALLGNYSSLPEEVRVHPGTEFWRFYEIQNSGEEPWPSGCCLVFAGGQKLSQTEQISVACLGPGSRATLRIDMVAPDQPGMYESKWRMSTSTGSFFGDVIWVIITVVDQSLNGLTQQLSSLTSLGSPPRSVASNNPFGPSHPDHQATGSVSSTMDDDGNMLC